MDDMERHASSYRWVVLLSAFTVNFLGDGLLSSFGVLLVELVDDFQDTTASVSAVGAIALGFFSFTSPFAGSITDAFGKRKVALVGALAFFIGFLTSSFAPNTRVLYFTYSVLSGVGFSLMYNPANASVMEYFTKQQSFAAGIALCGSGVGTFVLNILTGRLISAYGWRGALLVLSGLLLHGIPCGLVLRPPDKDIKYKEPSNPLKCDHYSERTVNGDKSVVKQNQKYNVLKLLLTDNLTFMRDLTFCCLMASAFLYGLAFFIPFALLPEEVVAMGIGKLEASWLASSLGIANTFGRIAFGWLGDRQFVSTKIWIGITVFLLSVSMSTSVLLTTFQTKLIFTCIYGTLFGGYISLMASVLVQTKGKESFGRTFGIFWLVFDAASLIGTPIAGLTFDRTGSFAVCYILAGSECLLSALVLLTPAMRKICPRPESKPQTKDLAEMKALKVIGDCDT